MAGTHRNAILISGIKEHPKNDLSTNKTTNKSNKKYLVKQLYSCRMSVKINVCYGVQWLKLNRIIYSQNSIRDLFQPLYIAMTICIILKLKLGIQQKFMCACEYIKNYLENHRKLKIFVI